MLGALAAPAGVGVLAWTDTEAIGARFYRVSTP